MINTTLCYIERDGSYLMLHRVKKKNDINHEKWIGVGGHAEEGESPWDCVRREITEETGLTPEGLRYRGLVVFVSDAAAEAEYMHLYTAHSASGEPADCDEGTLRWVRKEDIPLLPIWQGDKIFLRLLAEEAPFFTLKLVYRGDRLEQAVLDDRPLEV